MAMKSTEKARRGLARCHQGQFAASMPSARIPPPRVEELIALLQLAPHPEGGWFKRIFTAPFMAEPADGRGPRPALTMIYYLLAAGQHARWHKVRSDETWSLLEGGPLVIATFAAPTKSIVEHRLEASAGKTPQTFVVPAHHWQAAESPDAYSLVVCSVVPGFDWADHAWLSEHGTDWTIFRQIASDHWAAFA
jgi:predicted cupin superfamily sugar epimerase